MIVIGTFSPSAMSAVFFIAASLDASPSKSRVQTTYSGAETTIGLLATATFEPCKRSTTSSISRPAFAPWRSIEAAQTFPVPVGASAVSAPVDRSWTVGRVAVGSRSNLTMTGSDSAARPSGTRCQRRPASMLAGIIAAGRGSGVSGAALVGAVGFGTTAAGVHAAAIRTRVNTRARYLKVR